MATFGPAEASCEVLTFREGLLSPLAHDLVLRVTAFQIAVDLAVPSVEASFDAASLRVAAALRDGKALPAGALSASDAQKIERTIAGEVLRAPRFPAIRFSSSRVAAEADGYRVEGSLSVTGATRAIAFPVRRDGERLAAEVRLNQPDFGIRPYSGLLGAIRVQPVVVVRVSIPASAAA